MRNPGPGGTNWNNRRIGLAAPAPHAVRGGSAEDGSRSVQVSGPLEPVALILLGKLVLVAGTANCRDEMATTSAERVA